MKVINNKLYISICICSFMTTLKDNEIVKGVHLLIMNIFRFKIGRMIRNHSMQQVQENDINQVTFWNDSKQYKVHLPLGKWGS